MVDAIVVEAEAIVGRYDFDESVPGSMPSCKAKLNKTITNYTFDENIPGSMPARKPTGTHRQVAGVAGSIAGAGTTASSPANQLLSEAEAIVANAQQAETEMYVFNEDIPGSMPASKDRRYKPAHAYTFDENVPGSMPARKPVK